MQKLLIYVIACATLSLGGCALYRESWVHKIDIQQGNIVTQELVDQLKPGMTRRQVVFVMGSPLLTDPFHTDRWDYIYTFQAGGSSEREQRHVALHFDGDTLARIEGDFQPRDAADIPPREPTETTVSVSPKPRSRGVISRLWKSVATGEDETIPAAGSAPATADTPPAQ
jgi:outer membrane protein assembly factor BamE